MTLKKFIKKCTVYYSYFGIIIGIVIATFDIFDQSIPFYVGNTQFYGVTAGILSFIFMPIVMAIVGFFHSFLLYPLLKTFGFLKIKNKNL